MNGALLTGSHVYGTPHANSDIDLVVLLSPANMSLLLDLCPTHYKSTQGSAGDNERSCSIKFGLLNLIVTDDPNMLEAWSAGTETLKNLGRPATREEAVTVFKRLFGLVREGRNVTPV